MLSHKTRSSLTITVGTIVVTIGTLLLVALASGYNIDLWRGEIFATGLALLGTDPAGSTIKINSIDLKQKTPYRLEGVKTGTINIQYSKPDYHSWKASFFVRAGEVTFANYALLIPTVIVDNQIQSNLAFTDIRASSTSTKSYAFIDNPGLIYEIKSNYELRQVAELPVSDSIKTPIRQTDIQISPDGNAILSRAIYDDNSTAYFWVDANSGQLYNLNKLFNQPLVNIKFSPRNSREVYSLEAGKISRVNVDSKQLVSLPIANATSFDLNHDNIISLENLTPAESGQVLVRYDLNGANRSVLYQYLPTTKPWAITSSRVGNDIVIALLNPENSGLTVFRQLSGKNLSSFISPGAAIPSFSPEGRYLSFTQSQKLRTIDLEFTDRYSSSNSDIEQMHWLTKYQMLLKKPDGLYIIDYNTYNNIKIPPNARALADYKVTTAGNSMNVFYLMAGKINYYNLRPKNSLINFR